MVNGEELQVLYVRDKAECEEEKVHESATTKHSEPVNGLICNLHRLYRSSALPLLLLTKTYQC